MHAKLWLTVALTLVAWRLNAVAADTEQPTPGKQVASIATFTVAGDDGEREVTSRFWLALPADYDKDAKQRWPLVLFLHGSGEKGEDLEKVKIHGPPKLVAVGRQFPFVLVSPQCPSGSRWNPQELAKLVEYAANTYRIDRERIYVTGLSMGGSGTWSLLAANPGVFAAAMPLCGRGELEAAPKMAQTPIWVFVGGKDREETVQNCEEMVAALKKSGGEAKLTLYPDLSHDCWTVTYDNPDVYEWLLAHRLSAK